MQYTSPGAFRTGLEARLLNQSREAGIALGRPRRRVVFERLLARLARYSNTGWVLKGGMALEVRLVKDLADLVLLIDEGLGADADLLAVTERVFAEAATHEIPVEIKDPPGFWREQYSLLATDLELSATTLDEATATLRIFWSQVLAASTSSDKET